MVGEIEVRAAAKKLVVSEIGPYVLRLPCLWTTLDIIDRLDDRNIGGDLVECGVYKGGHMMAARAYMKCMDMIPRRCWLFDTFAGMTRPQPVDFKVRNGRPAMDHWRRDGNRCNNAGLSEVKANFERFSLLDEYVRFVEGPVEKTLRDRRNLPYSIAHLRLDTDWYASTKVELEVLYPRLVEGGALVIDDYGFWDGARRATDEYFGRALDFAKIDEAARLLFKP
jgi:O-methyltransferase